MKKTLVQYCLISDVIMVLFSTLTFILVFKLRLANFYIWITNNERLFFACINITYDI